MTGMSAKGSKRKMQIIVHIRGFFFLVNATTFPAQQVFDLRVTDVQSPPTAREEKSATDLAAKFLLLDEFVSLENDVIETKKKRSFSGFGSPLDRLSAGSVEHKGKQR